MEKVELNQIKRRVAKNVLSFRVSRGWTQEELARRASIARSNVTFVESGFGNPSLEILAQIAQALNVEIEELMSAPLRQFRVLKAKDLFRQNHNRSELIKVIPDGIRKLEMVHMVLENDCTLAGTQHLNGTLEYFYCVKGRISVGMDREHSVLEEGDLVIFSGDQKHNYLNYSKGQSEGISLIIFPHS